MSARAIEVSNGDAVRSFKDLFVWKQAIALAAECYVLTRVFPREEMFGLTSQIRRSAGSVPANIAEGTGRGTRKDYVQFLRIAMGSVRELESHLLLSVEVGVTTQEVAAPVLERVEFVAILLSKLIRSLSPPP